MKKVISLALSVMMLLSCFSALSAEALDAGDIADMVYTDESIAASRQELINIKVNNLPERAFTGDIRKAPFWNDVDLLGMDLDYLYNNEGLFIWSFFDVFVTDENGNKVFLNGSPVLKITTDEVSSAVTNLNLYLQRVFYSIYGGMSLFTVENAVSIANFIGRIITPDFKELQVADHAYIFNNRVPSSNEFYSTVCSISGLAEVISHNWIGKGINYLKPLIDLLGGTHVDFYEEYYTNAERLGAKIIEGAMNKIETIGPLEYIFSLLKAYSLSYDAALKEPTLDLLALKINAYQGYISENEFDSFSNLLRFLFCDCGTASSDNCYNNPLFATHFCPIEFPTARFGGAADSTEEFLYLYYYLNLCGCYAGNNMAVERWISSVNASTRLPAEDKTRLVALLRGLFFNEFNETVDKTIVPLYKENITTAYDSIFERFANTMMSLFKKIADYFDYLRKLFSGEIQYGQGNSPFN